MSNPLIAFSFLLPIIVSDVFYSSSLSFRKNRPSPFFRVPSSSLLSQPFIVKEVLSFEVAEQSLFEPKCSSLVCHYIYCPFCRKQRHINLSSSFLFLPCQCHRLLSSVDLSVHRASRAKSQLPLGCETVVHTV